MEVFLANLFAALVLFALALPSHVLTPAWLPTGIHLSRVLFCNSWPDAFVTGAFVAPFCSPCAVCACVGPLEVRLCCVTVIWLLPAVSSKLRLVTVLLGKLLAPIVLLSLRCDLKMWLFAAFGGFANEGTAPIAIGCTLPYDSGT